MRCCKRSETSSGSHFAISRCASCIHTRRSRARARFVPTRDHAFANGRLADCYQSSVRGLALHPGRAPTRHGVASSVTVCLPRKLSPISGSIWQGAAPRAKKLTFLSLLEQNETLHSVVFRQSFFQREVRQLLFGLQKTLHGGNNRKVGFHPQFVDNCSFWLMLSKAQVFRFEFHAR
jgi:hypothetical protein